MSKLWEFQVNRHNGTAKVSARLVDDNNFKYMNPTNELAQNLQAGLYSDSKSNYYQFPNVIHF